MFKKYVNVNLIKLFMHLKLSIVNAFMAPQLQTVNTSNTNTFVSLTVEREFVNTNFILMVTTLQFFIMLT